MQVLGGVLGPPQPPLKEDETVTQAAPGREDRVPGAVVLGGPWAVAWWGTAGWSDLECGCPKE